MSTNKEKKNLPELALGHTSLYVTSSELGHALGLAHKNTNPDGQNQD